MKINKERKKPCPKEFIPFIEDIIKKNPNITYKRIIEEGKKRKYPKAIQTCWMADVKDKMGILTRTAWNRGKISRFKERARHYIERIEHILDILTAGLLGGLVTYALIEGGNKFAYGFLIGFVSLVIFIRLIQKLYLEEDN